MKNIESIFVKPTNTVIEVLKKIDVTGRQIALVVDEQSKLIGVITDGDIRRYILKGKQLESECINCMRRDFKFVYEDELYKAHELTKKNEMRNLPVLNKSGQVIELFDRNEFFEIQDLLNPLVIMAGGKGKRLLPYTENCPKPMLRVGGKPILERLLEKSINNGFRNFYFSVNYLKEQIMDYFENGSKWKVNIKYLIEDKPCGTAGSLSLIKEKIQIPLIVINGDVLTSLDYKTLLNFHFENNAKATMCARSHEISVPFGVIKSKGIELESFVEKPTYRFQVNAGMYVLDPQILSLIKSEKFLDMPDLLELAKEKKNKVAICPLYENWLDIGQPETYIEADKNWDKF